MVRILVCSLKPTAEQTAGLLRTMRAFNAACDEVSSIAWAEQEFNNYRLRRHAYRQIREVHGLSSTLAQHAIAKVAATYRISRTTRAYFHPLGSVTYDRNILRLIGVSSVSLSLLDGREKVSLSIGGYQASRLKGAVLGETDLTYQPETGRFRLHFSIKEPAPEPAAPSGVLGVDLGITNLAVTSDGLVISSAHARGLRRRHLRLRARLQARGTRGARRKLRKRRHKEARFARHLNHVVSKQIVACAKDTGRGIALEDLKGIRDRITVRRAQRAVFSAWSFHQLRFFITYKAEEAGVPVFLVDPRNTSRTCPACKHVDRANRKSQAVFVCTACGHEGFADHVAAVEIGCRGASDHPYCSAGARSRPGQSPPV